MTTNRNDEIRRVILRYFHDRNQSATSRFGKKGYSAKISDVKVDLKGRHGLTQQQVVSNLNYLIDRGWINTVAVEKTVQLRGGTVPSTVTWYEISADGIDKIEGESEFESLPRYAGINIMATGENVITLGDGNVFNAEHARLHGELEALKDAVSASDGLTDEEKLDIAIDIETLKDQLVKSHPNKTLISHLWSGIEKAVVGAGFVDYALKIGPLIAPLVA
jgi:hypothetical protein